MSDGGARVEWAIFNHLSSGKTESKHPHTQRSPREHNFYLLLWPNQEVGFEEDLRKGKIKGRSRRNQEHVRARLKDLELNLMKTNLITRRMLAMRPLNSFIKVKT